MSLSLWPPRPPPIRGPPSRPAANEGPGSELCGRLNWVTSAFPTGARTGPGQGSSSRPGLEVWGLEHPHWDKIRIFFFLKKTISETLSEKQSSFLALSLK